MLTASLLGLEDTPKKAAADLRKVAHLFEAGNVVSDANGDMFRVRAKFAGPEGYVFKLADLQGNPVPTPADFYPVNRYAAKVAKWMRFVLAYNADWDQYVKEYIRAAGLPVDESYNWAKWFQAKFYTKLKGDDEVKDEAIHHTIITALAQRKALDANNPAGFQHAIKRFPEGVQKLPLEKQVTQFLLTLFSGRVQEANQFIDKMQRPDSDSMDADAPEEQEDQSTTNILDTEEHATQPVGQEEADFKADMNKFRQGFSTWLSTNNRPETAKNYLNLWDAMMYWVMKEHAEPKISDIYPFWARLTQDEKHPKGLGFDSLKQYWGKFTQLVRQFTEEHAEELQGNPLVEFVQRLPKAKAVPAKASLLGGLKFADEEKIALGPDGAGEIIRDQYCPLCGHSPIYKEDPAAGAPNPYFCHACSRGFNEPRLDNPAEKHYSADTAGAEFVGDNDPDKMASGLPTGWDIQEAVGGGYIVTKDGLQWGRGPRDLSGAASEVFPTYDAAAQAIDDDGIAKASSDVSGDVAEARSAVVSPDSVDSDIKQTTEPIEKQAGPISEADDLCNACGTEVANRECAHGILCDTCDEQVHGLVGGVCELEQRSFPGKKRSEEGAPATPVTGEVPCADCGAAVSAADGLDDETKAYLCDDCYWKRRCPDCEHLWARHSDDYGCEYEYGDVEGDESGPAYARGPCGCKSRPNKIGKRLTAGIGHEFTDGIRPQTNVEDTGRLEGDSGPGRMTSQDANWRVEGAGSAAPPSNPGVGGAQGLTPNQNPNGGQPSEKQPDPAEEDRGVGQTVLPNSGSGMDEDNQPMKKTVPPDLPFQRLHLQSLQAATLKLAGADKEVVSKLDGAAIFDTIRWSPKYQEYICKRGYFYTHGMTEDKLAEAVKKVLPEAIISSARNFWHPWPKDSWFEVRFKVPAKAQPATPEAPVTTEPSQQEAVMAEPKAQGATASKRSSVLEKIKARKAAKNTSKWATLRRVAEENAPEAAEALDQLASAFGELADRVDAFRENLDLVDAPKSASLKTRIAARRSLGARLKKYAQENPEVLADAVNDLFHSLDDVAAGVEAFAENMGIELTMTPAEEAFVDEGQAEVEGETPAVESEPVKVDEGKEQEGEEELAVEANGGAGARGWTNDRDENGQPKLPQKVDRMSQVSQGEAPAK